MLDPTCPGTSWAMTPNRSILAMRFFWDSSPSTNSSSKEGAELMCEDPEKNW